MGNILAGEEDEEFNHLECGLNYCKYYELDQTMSTAISIIHGRLATQASDYLRSLRYLLPYKGLSVEELIEYGWAKERG